MSAKSRQSDGDGPAKRRPSEPQPDENPDVSPQTAGDRFAAAQGSRSAAVLAAHFQLRSTFERYLLPAMYVRPATTSVGSLSYVAPQLAHHVLDNEAGSRLRRVAVGVKVTENNGRSSLFRLTQAGAQLLYPYAQRQVVRLGVSAFRRLLFNVGARLEADFLGLSAAKVAELQPGPCIIVVQRPKATSCRPAADTRQRRLAVKASRQAAIVAAEGDDEKPFKTRGRLGRGLFKALFTTGESQPLVFAGQFSTDPARLKLCIPFSKVCTVWQSGRGPKCASLPLFFLCLTLFVWSLHWTFISTGPGTETQGHGQGFVANIAEQSGSDRPTGRAEIMVADAWS